MINFIETKSTANNELKWFIEKASVANDYGDCIEKRFVGKVPYQLAMKAIKGNKWGKVSEGGQGKSSYWLAQSMNAGFNFNTYTGIVGFTFYQAK